MYRRRRKYGNKKVVLDSITFDSRSEARRYTELRLLEAAGEIENLLMQEPFHIVVNGKKICKYLADFSYFDKRKQVEVIEDIKSEITQKEPYYRIKKKLVNAVYPHIDFREICSKKRR